MAVQVDAIEDVDQNAKSEEHECEYVADAVDEIGRRTFAEHVEAEEFACVQKDRVEFHHQGENGVADGHELAHVIGE